MTVVGHLWIHGAMATKRSTTRGKTTHYKPVRKEESLRIRVTTKEKGILERAAAKRLVSLSQFILSAALAEAGEKPGE